MTKYEKLLIEAEKSGAEVRELDFGTEKPCGRCLDNIIYINSQISEKNKCLVLAEELGHYHRTVGDITDLSDINNKKQELKARRCGYKLLIEPDDIVHAMKNGCNSKFEISEYLNITESFLDELIEDYRRQYGIGIRVGTYLLKLEPSLGLVTDLGGLFEYKRMWCIEE